jgi:ribosomal protein S18 acetylase RimI-like enzyme
MTDLDFEPSTHGVGPADAGLPVSNAAARGNTSGGPAPAVHGALDCGWGRLLFAPAFGSPKDLAQALLQEQPGRRDIALYVEAPQLVLAEAPSQLFLDPSLVFRRPLDATADAQADRSAPGIVVRRLSTRADITAINRLYGMRRMVLLDPAVVWAQRQSDALIYLVAEDERTGDVIGSVLGIDHVAAFDDPEGGSSLWCLAVDRQDAPTGTGEALVRGLAERFGVRGRAYVDLSVLHDNDAAIALYRKLGFRQTSALCVKRKNTVNAPCTWARPMDSRS